MARGMKRAASKSAGAARKKRVAPVKAKCSVVGRAVRAEQSLPLPVRKIISDRLVHVFGTYKEERHPFQKSVSDLVGKTLKTTESNLQAAINEANGKKGVQEQEGATLSTASLAAHGASEAASNAAAESKAALDNAKTQLRDAKTALHDIEQAVKTAADDKVATQAKKAKLGALISEFLKPVREGTLDKGLSKSASWIGKSLGREHGSVLEREFLECVTRTFSKKASAWGTFDHIVDKELAESLEKIIAGLGSDIEQMERDEVTRAADVEKAKAAVTGAEERVTAADGVNNANAAAAKDAKAAAKAAATAMKQQQHNIDKATHALENAEGAMAAFKKGPLAAYTEVEANTAPPPEPEPVAEAEAPAPAVQAAMAPAPAPAERSRVASILSSPAVMLQQARSMITSPRIAQSPKTS